MKVDNEVREFLMVVFDLTKSEFEILYQSGTLEHGFSTITMKHDSIGIVVTEYFKGRFYQEFKF